jgi:excisionase family DNA binding protein
MARPKKAQVVEFPSKPVESTSEPILLDIPAAARALSVSTWSIRGLIWNKEIPFIKIGKKHLIDPADLRAFVARQKERAA